MNAEDDARLLRIEALSAPGELVMNSINGKARIATKTEECRRAMADEKHTACLITSQDVLDFTHDRRSRSSRQSGPINWLAHTRRYSCEPIVAGLPVLAGLDWTSPFALAAPDDRSASRWITSTDCRRKRFLRGRLI